MGRDKSRFSSPNQVKKTWIHQKITDESEKWFPEHAVTSDSLLHIIRNIFGWKECSLLSWENVPIYVVMKKNRNEDFQYLWRRTMIGRQRAKPEKEFFIQEILPETPEP